MNGECKQVVFRAKNSKNVSFLIGLSDRPGSGEASIIRAGQLKLVIIKVLNVIAELLRTCFNSQAPFGCELVAIAELRKLGNFGVNIVGNVTPNAEQLETADGYGVEATLDFRSLLITDTNTISIPLEFSIILSYPFKVKLLRRRIRACRALRLRCS